MNQLGRIEENRTIRLLLRSARRYVEGYAEDQNNHPQARAVADDLNRRIKQLLD